MNEHELQAMCAESGIEPDDAADLTRSLAPLRELCATVPEASPELRALFGDASERSAKPGPLPLRSAHRTRSAVAGVVVVAMAGVGATGFSAAANTLPRAWQQQVSQFSHHYLPFDFPEPVARSDEAGTPAAHPRRSGDRGAAEIAGARTSNPPSNPPSRSAVTAREEAGIQARPSTQSGHRPGTTTPAPLAGPVPRDPVASETPSQEPHPSSAPGDARTGHDGHDGNVGHDGNDGHHDPGPGHGSEKGSTSEPPRPDKPAAPRPDGPKGKPVDRGQGSPAQPPEPTQPSPGDGTPENRPPRDDGAPGSGDSPGDSGGQGGQGETGPANQGGSATEPVVDLTGALGRTTDGGAQPQG
jgi:hypothetical protein